MSEGEIKKRIKHEIETATKLQYSPLRPRNQSEVAGMLEVGILPNLEKIIEDAKKELYEGLMYTPYMTENTPVVKTIKKLFGDKEK